MEELAKERTKARKVLKKWSGDVSSDEFHRARTNLVLYTQDIIEITVRVAMDAIAIFLN